MPRERPPSYEFPEPERPLNSEIHRATEQFVFTYTYQLLSPQLSSQRRNHVHRWFGRQGYASPHSIEADPLPETEPDIFNRFFYLGLITSSELSLPELHYLSRPHWYVSEPTSEPDTVILNISRDSNDFISLTPHNSDNPFLHHSVRWWRQSLENMLNPLHAQMDPDTTLPEQPSNLLLFSHLRTPHVLILPNFHQTAIQSLDTQEFIFRAAQQSVDTPLKHLDENTTRRLVGNLLNFSSETRNLLGQDFFTRSEPYPLRYLEDLFIDVLQTSQPPDPNDSSSTRRNPSKPKPPQIPESVDILDIFSDSERAVLNAIYHNNPETIRQAFSDNNLASHLHFYLKEFLDPHNFPEDQPDIADFTDQFTYPEHFWSFIIAASNPQLTSWITQHPQPSFDQLGQAIINLDEPPPIADSVALAKTKDIDTHQYLLTYQKALELRQYTAPHLEDNFEPAHLVVSSPKVALAAATIDEYIFHQGQKRYTLSWGQRLEALNLVANLPHTQVHISTEEIDKVFFQAWAQPNSLAADNNLSQVISTLETNGFPLPPNPTTTDFLQLPQPAKTLVAHMRRRGQNSALNHAKVRAHLAHQKLRHPEQNHPPSPEQIDRREHLFPIFLARTGYEIEQYTEDDQKKLLYSLFHSIRINQEGDFSELETAPGPFFHPQTEIDLFKYWVDADLVSFNEQHGYVFGLHTNCEFTNENLGIVLGRLLMCNATCFHPDNIPIISDKLPDTHGLRLYDHDTYSEFKDFQVYTPSGFEDHIYKAAMASTAFTTLEQLLPPPLADKFAISDLTPTDIESSPLPQYQKDLAVIGHQLVKDFYFGLSQNDLQDLLQFNCPMEHMNIVSSHIRTVYPNKWQLGHINPMDISIEGFDPILLDGHQFPNLVAFGQYVSAKAAHAVQEIIDRVEQEATTELKTLSLRSKPTTLQDFFSRYPFGFHPTRINDTKLLRQHFHLVRKYYGLSYNAKHLPENESLHMINVNEPILDDSTDIDSDTGNNLTTSQQSELQQYRRQHQADHRRLANSETNPEPDTNPEVDEPSLDDYFDHPYHGNSRSDHDDLGGVT